MIEAVLEQFKKSRILIIGDVMLDKYIEGHAHRISPEAPVPVIAVATERYVPGGAANVANNIVCLGGHAIIIGLIGKDIAGDTLRKMLKDLQIDVTGLVQDPDYRTIEKIRIIAQRQQVVRVDYEGKYHNGFDELCRAIERKMDDTDLIIISDYHKGVINEKIMEFIKKTATKRNIKIIVDPKPPHNIMYKNVHLVTPNLKEAEELSGIRYTDEESVRLIGEKMQKTLNTSVIITRGEHGMDIFEKGVKRTNIPTDANQVFDVSGAGDTVMAALSLCIASKLSLRESATIANYAAGIVVAKHGTATVTPDELRKRFYQVNMRI